MKENDKKNKKGKRFELRLSETELNKLQIRANLYTKGNISKLVRYWISKGSVPKGDHQ